ncbi:MAG: hypothetical protein H0W02_03360 [Ktedonobacteraceae bacterium]|nr:hypothetical protein [Ktedonobacteraceae bacterium]
MVLSLRRTATVVVMMLVLLLSMLGWAIRAESASRAMMHSINMHTSHHTAAFTCPPPPRMCVPPGH